MERGRTYGEAWKAGARRLAEAGVDDTEAEAGAELLILHVLGIGKAELLRDLRELFPEAKRQAWETMLARRAAGEPAQYVTGEQYFYGRRFAVTPAVLIPRPETELLAEAVLEEAARLVAARKARRNEELAEAEGFDGTGESADGMAASDDAPKMELRVLDVGTGSGALAVTLKLEQPGWQVTASDLSPDALEVAAGNAAALGASVRFVQGDLLAPFLAGGAHAGERIDILVSNPPYIPSSDLPGLQAEVREHEPHLALDGGPDGLAPYRRMAEQLSGLTELPAMVAWEVGIHQAVQAAALLREAADWDEIRVVRDYAGIDRHVLALRF
ncbi:peptide chain release factor N(5)-glutamine methyltransferase [Cohnella ginsengisoli]|uniref:Release factor glutamine methyltransferase n=1 Tax=Cohnella ginsengisoli TaxID=425004 RepID=A0A9X4KRP2_9BACL|nr:peptide chain release factor N(5)-glutamine methyltransferase [Cohnella ginsengisoli]MDG0794460.1 peptide chain release factor N(5)-glutamine methyltransferase [Cohnella ginsengisoli]